MWTRWRCRRCFSDILAGLQGKHKKAVFEKNKGWYSGSSSSSSEERVSDQEEEEELKRLRANVELLGKQQRWSKGLETHGEPTRRGSGLEEDRKMEVGEGTDCKKKLDERRKHLQRQMRDFEKFTDLDPNFRDRQRECWKEELQEIERKRTELLPEHQKMQKKSQTLQSLHDKKRNYLKDAGDGEEEMRTISEENEEMQARFQARFQKSLAIDERKQVFWKKKVRSCSQGRKEEAAVPDSPMDVALIQPWCSTFSRWEQHRPCSSSPFFRKKSGRANGWQHQPEPAAPEMWQEEKKKIGKEIGTMRRRQVGGMKALRWIMLWTLLGVHMQTVEALEEGIPARQETDCMLETAPVLRVDNEVRWKRMNTCDRGWRERERWQKEKSKNSQGLSVLADRRLVLHSGSKCSSPWVPSGFVPPGVLTVLQRSTLGSGSACLPSDSMGVASVVKQICRSL